MMRVIVLVFATLLLANTTLLASGPTFVQVKSATPQTASRVGGSDLYAGADSGEPECGGGGVERHDVDGEYGERQPGEQLCAGDRTDDWDRVATQSIYYARGH